MLWPPPPLASPVQDRIAWAVASCETTRATLRSDETVEVLLARFRRAAESSREAMQSSGIVEICRRCDEIEGGSCCGAGLEKHYDAVLLLINRLLGTVLPGSRRDSHSCFFLGPEGCLLSARHVLCVNYVCRKITDRIRPERLARLREREGEELETLFHLHERIKKVLKP